MDYPPITSHCCASRITAENPDEGFKPTSGKIHSVRFQSSGAFEKKRPKTKKIPGFGSGRKSLRERTIWLEELRNLIRSVDFRSVGCCTGSRVRGDCWGYFSCGLKGAIHEFADSQFGHIFAKGPNREAARKSLRFALMNLESRDSGNCGFQFTRFELSSCESILWQPPKQMAPLRNQWFSSAMLVYRMVS